MYTHPMQPHQLEFWSALLAPFPEHLLSHTTRGGKNLTYIDKRAIMNRLDSVCGMDGWYPEYEATARGYKCRLHIRIPTETPGTWIFMVREDGAGFEEMGSYNKQTNEWEADVDNDEKSGYTNALRRAAQDAWGIGRYLYNKGIPSFLDPNARAFDPAPATNATVAPQPPPTASVPATQFTPSQPQFQPQAPAQQSPPRPQYDNFRIPKAGKGVYGWARSMETHYQTSIFEAMVAGAIQNGFTKYSPEWPEELAHKLVWDAIRYITTLPNYKGEFEPLIAETKRTLAETAAPATRPAAAPTAPPIAASPELPKLRSDLVDELRTFLERQTGTAPDPTALKAAFQHVSSKCADSGGEIGKQADSLSTLSDGTWIGNMITFVKRQKAELEAAMGKQAGAGNQGDPNIPF
jgi:hypothetical protein